MIWLVSMISNLDNLLFRQFQNIPPNMKIAFVCQKNFKVRFNE
jgi:hypothetical protein